MSRPPDLLTATRAFANDIRRLLDQTVCRQSLVGCLPIPGAENEVAVGSKLNVNNLDSRPIQLNTYNTDAYCWLNLVMRLYYDPRGFLTVRSSTFGILVGPEQHDLFHFDYERGKDTYADGTVAGTV